MKPTDFAKHLTEFLSVYLPSQKNVSKNTICSYRDTFKLMIRYCQEKESIPAEKITMGGSFKQSDYQFSGMAGK